MTHVNAKCMLELLVCIRSSQRKQRSGWSPYHESEVNH